MKPLPRWDTSSLLISVAECADRLAISEESVYALVDSGQWLGSQRAGRKPVISRAAFDRLYGAGVWHSDETPITSPFVRSITARLAS